MDDYIAHDSQLLILYSVLIVCSLEVLGEDPDSLLQNLVVKSHLTLALSFIWAFFALLLTGARARRQIRSPAWQALLIISQIFALIRLSISGWCLLNRVATSVILTTKLKQVLLHQLASLIQIASRFWANSINESVRHVFYKRTPLAMLAHGICIDHAFVLFIWATLRVQLSFMRVSQACLIAAVQGQSLKSLQQAFIIISLVDYLQEVIMVWLLPGSHHRWCRPWGSSFILGSYRRTAIKTVLECLTCVPQKLISIRDSS